MKSQTRKESLAIVGTVGLPANYGGWETLVENIVGPLSDKFDVTVYCSAGRYTEQVECFSGAKLVYLKLDANGVQSILYDILSLWKSRRFDKVLILGTSGCIALPVFKVLFGCIYFLNIDGLEWKRQKWSKLAKAFLKISEYVGCKFSHYLISDNAVITRYIKDSYDRDSELIAYGGDSNKIAETVNIVSDQAIEDEYFFSVCRIEPENNTHLILEAFSKATSKNLIFVGNWNSSEYGRSLQDQYSRFSNITILDPIYDRSRLDSYRMNCKAYIHGHSAGGTNPSLVEAMSLNLPIFSFDVNFNRETTENCALYFKSTCELRDLLDTTDDCTLKGISEKMSEIASRRYTWQAVSKSYVDFISND
tara:strand:- start:1414 stop:2505 length:1092 start_codon:yes stop_codon:yes gene_type:complete